MSKFRHLTIVLAFTSTGCSQSSLATTKVIAHPDKSGATIEYFVAQPAGLGPWPTIVFLHGFQPLPFRKGGKAFEDWGVLDRFAKKGYCAISVSLPGYGGSSGPEDFAGPFTQHAVKAVIAKAESDYLAIHDRILIEGVSLGAVTSALVTAHDPHIAGQVLISGLYDLPSFFAHPKSAAAERVKLSMVAQTGGNDAAMRARSALLFAPNIKAATLILNGAKDDRTDTGQAQQFASVINSSGGNARVHIFPEFGHEIPVVAREVEVDAFIDAVLKP